MTDSSDKVERGKAQTERLFDESVLRKLDRLTLIASRVRAGALKGDRRSKKRGTSLEFADYRNYTRGDDLRRVDWNVYARLERPFIKLFEEEEDLAVHLLIDASESMNWPRGGEEGGNPEHNKFKFAQRIMAGLGYIALGAGDNLAVTALYSDSRSVTWGPFRGQGRALPLINHMALLFAGGLLDMNEALRDYAMRFRRPGLVILISDLLSPRGFQDGLSTLQSAGHEIALLHILSPDEIDPPLAGDLQLVDVETGMVQDVTIDASMRDMYAGRLLAWRGEITAFCLKRGIHYATVDSSTQWEELILYELRRLGVIN
jgi:uncharacterized protein (DUF58 family)